MKKAVHLLTAASGISVASSSLVDSGSPVERIVNLLGKLQAEVKEDGKKEEKIYNKFACWCDKSLKLKADAIDEARAEIRSTGQTILTLKGRIATLTAELEQLAKEIEENQKTQEKATKLREQGNAAYVKDTDESKEAVAALEKAVKVLVSGQGGASMLQVHRDSVKDVLAALPMASAKVSTQHISLLSEFVQNKAHYAPQSATITGILQNMYDTFSGDLEDATVDEANANREYEDLMKTLADELATMQKQTKEKTEEKAESESALADNTELYDDTHDQMKADISFFDKAKDQCLEKSKQWNIRKAARAEELEGFAAALEILTSDEARALFNKSIKPGKETGAAASFLQVDASRAPIEHAYSALKAVASRTKNLQLAQLAVEIREAKVGHFDTVIKSIDKLVGVLQKEQESDDKKKAYCKQEYQAIALGSEDLVWRVEKSQAKIDKLTRTIEKQTEEKAKTEKEIKDTQQLQKDMTAQRKSENEEFLQANEDDEQTVALLSKAKEVMSAYYKKHKVEMGKVQGSVKGAAFAQDEPEFEVSQWQAPEADFSSKGARKGQSKNIVSFMTMLIEDAQDEIRTAIKAEKEAQEEYEESMAAAKKLERELKEKKVSLEDSIAKRGEEKDAEIIVRDTEQKTLDSVLSYKEKIKPDCDWILEYYDERMKKRTAESEGLNTAKDFLAGANTFVQKSLRGHV